MIGRFRIRDLTPSFFCLRKSHDLQMPIEGKGHLLGVSFTPVHHLPQSCAPPYLFCLPLAFTIPLPITSMFVNIGIQWLPPHPPTFCLPGHLLLQDLVQIPASLPQPSSTSPYRPDCSFLWAHSSIHPSHANLPDAVLGTRVWKWARKCGVCNLAGESI